jgi:hypothetical protein
VADLEHLTNSVPSCHASAVGIRGFNRVRVHGPGSLQLAAFSSHPEGELAGLLTAGDGGDGNGM